MSKNVTNEARYCFILELRLRLDKDGKEEDGIVIPSRFYLFRNTWEPSIPPKLTKLIKRKKKIEIDSYTHIRYTYTCNLKSILASA